MKSVDWDRMSPRNDLIGQKEERNHSKLKKYGYEMVTANASTAELSENFGQPDFKPWLNRLDDCTSFSMYKVPPRKDTYRSIHTFKDQSLASWFNTRPHQLETIDLAKVSLNFDKIGNRTTQDQRALKFSYDKPVGEIVSDFDQNKQQFYKDIIKNRGYKVKSLRSVLHNKGLID